MKKHLPRLPRSVRKYIRREKARMRALVPHSQEAEKNIKDLVFTLRSSYSKSKLGMTQEKTIWRRTVER